MPLTKYSNAQEALLTSFETLPNFRTNSFTFFNKITGTVLKDAIVLDNSGRLKFKDIDTEVYFDDLISRKKFINDTINEYDEEILYFEDEFNSKISLGEMYVNIQRFINSNLVFWHHDRVSKALSGGLDRYIIENVYKSYQEINVNDNITVKDFITHKTDIWKNKWLDIPCMQVVTPEYVNGCVANITARISMKVRNDKPLYTGFRILDGTTGLELARTIHASKGQHGKEVTYTIPLSYQGPLPDSEPDEVKESNSIITYKDIQNITYNPNNNEFSSTPLESQLTYGIKNTKHVIKLQWITCDLAADILPSGEVTESLIREFDPKGNTSLEISIFSSNATALEVAEINGNIYFDEIEENTYVYEFTTRPYGLNKEYTLNISCNKNANISVLSKSINGFVISTNIKPKGLIIDWSITYNVNESISAVTLNDKARELNHGLFKERATTIDFCNELKKLGKAPGATYKPLKPIIPFCECCDCCTDDSVDVMYTLINGSEDLSCNDSIITDKVDLEDCERKTSIVVETPYVYAVDSFGRSRYSYDLDFIFKYFVEIKITTGQPEGLGEDNASKSGAGAETSYDFLKDLYGDKALAGADALGRLEPESFKTYKNITEQSNDSYELNKKSPTESTRPTFMQDSNHCSYSFEKDSIVTTKIVDENTQLEVYKILNSNVAITCEDEIIDEEPITQIEIEEKILLTRDIYQTVDFKRTIQKRHTINSIFGENLLFNGLDNLTEDILINNNDKLTEYKQLGLEKLKYDKNSIPNELPAQLEKANLIKLNFQRNELFDSYFENSTSSYLYTSNGLNTKSFINTNEGYLSIKAFRHNLLSFDPNPNIQFTLEDTPYFPTFDPIGNKKTLQEILEYIYTATYPVDNIPVFPNFKIGDVVINGALYNPLYDYRNYRTFGVYQTYSNNGVKTKVFSSDPISLYVPSLKIGKLIKIGDKFYQVKRDFNNTGPINTSVSPSGIIQKVIPSGIIYKSISEELYNLNPTLQVTL